jgi:hypothetical protein
MINYTVDMDGEVFMGSFLFPCEHMPEVYDTIHIPIPGRDTLVRVAKVRLGVHDHGVQHLDLAGKIAGEVTRLGASRRTAS